MERKITHKGELLNKKGLLNDHGYGKSMVLKYNKSNIKKQKRIKEWDYYLVNDDRYALCLTISNLSYVAVISASVVDLINSKHYNKTSMLFFPKNKEFLPESSKSGVSELKTKDGYFKFEVKQGKRHLSGYLENFYKKATNNEKLEFDITLSKEPKDSMVKVTPFKNKSHFYYNQKINCMIAEGFFTFKGKKYWFYPDAALATLDWGRGVLPYNSMWYWASMQNRLDGKLIGFNFGYALGDNTQATENMIFYEGQAHKISDTRIYIQRDKKKRDYMGTWTFYSDDGKVELIFEPIVDRYDPFNIVLLKFVPHQVFGKYTGKVTLEDGTVIKLENMLGFSERVVNRW